MIAFAEPTEWWLEIPPSVRESGQLSQLYTTHSSRRAYINYTCLSVLLPWLQAEYALEATVWPSFTDLAALWEVVNGTAIMLGKRRLVLVPTETIDDSNLEIPQEWVDIPSWVADYYLAVQFQLDEPWMRVWGYTTHQELKTMGSYDPSDRTYCMDAQNLTRDLHAFRLICQFCLEEQTQAEVVSLPELPVAQAENLIQQLGSSSVIFPRLAVPFILWGALLERQEWRQRLCQQRQTNQRHDVVIVKPPVHLTQWLQNSFEAGWQPLKALFIEPENLALSFRAASDANRFEVTRCKLIDLELHQAVVLLVGLEAEADERVRIGVQLYPTRGNPYVPAQLSLSLLSQTGEILQSVQAQSRDDYMQLRRFRCPLGTRFSLQIALDAGVVTEEFVV